MGLASELIVAHDLGTGVIALVALKFTGTYPTGGEEVTPPPLGLRVGVVNQITLAGGGTVYHFEWNPGTNKIMVFRKNTDNEVANGTDLTGLDPLRCVVHGR